MVCASSVAVLLYSNLSFFRSLASNEVIVAVVDAALCSVVVVVVVGVLEEV